MARRRGHGEGTIYLRKDGRWEARLTVAPGERKSYLAKTRAEALAKMQGAQRDLHDGIHPVDERTMLAQYLTGWLEAVKPTVTLDSWLVYASHVRRHIAPEIGQVRLARLTGHDLQRLYSRLIDGGLSSSSVRDIHGVLRHALGDAERLALVPRNVAASASAPRRQHVEIQPLTREQACVLLEASAADEHRLHALWTLALATGMRQGELLALEWRAVDLAAGLVHVHGTLKRRPKAYGGYVVKEPKTKRSRRTVRIPPNVVEALRAHKARQARGRLAMGPAWHDELDLVFANEVGYYLSNDSVYRWFLRLLKRAALPKIRFHDLRHTFATLALAVGVNVKVVSEILGHSTIAMTLEIYGHVLPNMQEHAVAAMGDVLFG